MRRKLVKRLITLGVIKVFVTIGVLLFFAVFSEGDASAGVGKSSEIINEGHAFEKLDPNKVTTKWNDSYLFSSREDALKELDDIKK